MKLHAFNGPKATPALSFAKRRSSARLSSWPSAPPRGERACPWANKQALFVDGMTKHEWWPHSQRLGLPKGPERARDCFFEFVVRPRLKAVPYLAPLVMTAFWTQCTHLLEILKEYRSWFRSPLRIKWSDYENLDYEKEMNFSPPQWDWLEEWGICIW